VLCAYVQSEVCCILQLILVPIIVTFCASVPQVTDGHLEHVGVLPVAFPGVVIVKFLNSPLILRRKH